MAYYSNKRRNGVDGTYIAAGVIVLVGILAIILVLNIFKAQDEKAAQGKEEQPAYTSAATAPDDEDDVEPAPAPGDDQPDTPLPSEPDEPDEPDEEPDETEVPQELTTAATKSSEDEQPVTTTASTSEKTKGTTASTAKKSFDASLKDSKATKSTLKSMMKSSDYSLFSDTMSSGSCVSAEFDKSSSMSKFQYLMQGECECILLCGSDGSVAAAVCDYGEIRYYGSTSALRKSVPSCIRDYFSLAYPGAEIIKCN